MTDQSWADFREEAFGDAYMVWHDGPDFTELRDRWRTDPELVERMLLAGIADDDALASQAIGELDLDADGKRRFADALLALSPWGTFEVRTAESLITLTGDERFASRIAKVLTDPVHWGDRIDAAMSLKKYRPTEELITALEAGLRDQDNLVRHHSAESLLAYARDPEPDISAHDEDFGVLVADDPKGWASLATKLGDAARRANSLGGHAIDT